MTLLSLTQALASQLQDALEAGALSLGHGTQSAWDEAAWLVLWAAQLPLDSEIDQRILSQTQIDRAQDLLQQRLRTRQPLAYLTGLAWLQGLAFEVDQRVIIPRSLIAETLVEGSLQPWLCRPPRRGLDLCTGNGSLAVLAALNHAELELDASDISADALAVAARNLHRHGVQERVRLVHSDGLAALTGPYDLVLCNPPYVNRASMAMLPAEYRCEPALALAGGEDGMDFIRPLLAALPAVLAPEGLLVLEIGNERAHFDAAFPALNPVWLSTSAGDDQVLLLTRKMLT